MFAGVLLTTIALGAMLGMLVNISLVRVMP